MSEQTDLPATVPKLDVSIPDVETVTEAEAVVALREEGLVGIRANWFSGLEKLGLYVKKGTIATQRGLLMTTQARVNQLFSDLMETANRIANDKKLTLSQRTTYLQRLAAGASGLAKVQIEAVKAQIELEKTVKPMNAPLEEEPVRNQAFESGKPVTLGLSVYTKEAHFHEQK